MKKVLMIVMVCVFSIVSLTGCYYNQDVGTNQIAVQLYKNEVVSVSGAGLYSDGRYWADLKVIDADTITFSVEDPEVLTEDNQAVGLKVTIQARRNADSESVMNMMKNWSTLLSNDMLISTISSTAREGMKNATRGYSLTELLNDRNGLAGGIMTELEADTAKYSVEIVNVTVENVAINPEYMTTLNEKAQLVVETQKEQQRQELIKQMAANDKLQAQQTTEVLAAQLIQAAAQTELDVAIAAREGAKIAEANKVYELNDKAYNLEVLRLMKDIIGDKTVFYIPEGMTINQFIGNLAGLGAFSTPQ